MTKMKTKNKRGGKGAINMYLTTLDKHFQIFVLVFAKQKAFNYIVLNVLFVRRLQYRKHIGFFFLFFPYQMFRQLMLNFYQYWSMTNDIKYSKNLNEISLQGCIALFLHLLIIYYDNIGSNFPLSPDKT